MSQHGIIRHHGHYATTIHGVLMAIFGWYQDVLVMVWSACSCWWRRSSGCSRACTAQRCSRRWSPPPCTRGWSTSWICTFLEISNTIYIHKHDVRLKFCRAMNIVWCLITAIFGPARLKFETLLSRLTNFQLGDVNPLAVDVVVVDVAAPGSDPLQIQLSPVSQSVSI